MPPSNTNSKSVGTNGRLSIIVTQGDQDPVNLVSKVHVDGNIQNLSSNRIQGTAFNSWIHGNQNYDGGSFGYDLALNDSMTFIQHTFDINAGDRGFTDVDFTVHYGYTGRDILGDYQSISAHLDLDRIKTVPDPPVNLGYNSLTPTSVVLTWNRGADNGGYDVQGFVVKRWDGDVDPVNALDHVTYPETGPDNLSKSFNDLVPGQTYTYTVQAKNKAQHNGGLSLRSDPLVVNARTGVFIRHGGSWVRALPYVRDGGTWKPVQTLVRRGGQWKATNN